MKWVYVLIGAVMIGAYGLIGSMDRADAEREQSHYCEMIQLWDDTNGEAGWPPYKGEGQCQ